MIPVRNHIQFFGELLYDLVSGTKHLDMSREVQFIGALPMLEKKNR